MNNFANSGHILLIKKITIHGCDTSMEYLKMGLLAAYRFNNDSYIKCKP